MTSTTEREENVVDLLTADLRQAREDYAGERARAEQLAAENANLRRWLTWRTIGLEILLLGVAAISAGIWATRWWPWE